MQKRDGADTVPLDKRRRVASVRTAGAAVEGRGRRVLGAVNKQEASAANDAGAAEGSETAPVEFTKEDILALVNEKFKGKRFETKVRTQFLI